MSTSTLSSEALVERLFGSVLGMMDVYMVYVGDRLGFYRALAAGAMTPAALAVKTGTDARYVREWLEQQAVTGILAGRQSRRSGGAAFHVARAVCA